MAVYTAGLLCVTAHPDDETIFAGALLAMLAAHDTPTHIVCATRGEDGALGDPPVCTREELGRVREEELRRAAASLGVHSVHVLGYLNPSYVIDSPELTAFEADSAEFERRIHETITQLRPRVIVTHGSQGEYGHPGHVKVHETVIRVHERLRTAGGKVPALYTFAARPEGRHHPNLNDADRAHLLLAVSAWTEQKTAALACHRTQRALFFDTFPHAVTMQDIVLAHGDAECLHRIWTPAVFDELGFFGDRVIRLDSGRST
jgi:LmbE family N-acetylglucosaminyl deacetylase